MNDLNGLTKMWFIGRPMCPVVDTHVHHLLGLFLEIRLRSSQKRPKREMHEIKRVTGREMGMTGRFRGGITKL